MKRYIYTEVRRPFGANQPIDNPFPIVYPIDKIITEEKDGLISTGISHGKFIFVSKELLKEFEKINVIPHVFAKHYSEENKSKFVIYKDEEWKAYLMKNNGDFRHSITPLKRTLDELLKELKGVIVVK